MSCIIEDGVLKPCSGLDRAMADEANSRRKGISLLVLHDFKNGDFNVSRTCAVLRSGNLGVNGCVVNYCPFCGVSIANHMEAEDDTESATTLAKGGS